MRDFLKVNFIKSDFSYFKKLELLVPLYSPEDNKNIWNEKQLELWVAFYLEDLGPVE